jgi:hypothetical protein
LKQSGCALFCGTYSSSPRLLPLPLLLTLPCPVRTVQATTVAIHFSLIALNPPTHSAAQNINLCLVASREFGLKEAELFCTVDLFKVSTVRPHPYTVLYILYCSMPYAEWHTFVLAPYDSGLQNKEMALYSHQTAAHERTQYGIGRCASLIVGKYNWNYRSPATTPRVRQRFQQNCTYCHHHSH